MAFGFLGFIIQISGYLGMLHSSSVYSYDTEGIIKIINNAYKKNLHAHLSREYHGPTCAFRHLLRVSTAKIDSGRIFSLRGRCSSLAGIKRPQYYSKAYVLAS